MGILLLAVMLFLLPLSSYATDYYVDKDGVGGVGCSAAGNGRPNNGAGQPKCTILQGAALLSPGDTLWVRQGTYTDNMQGAGDVPNGTSTQWVTIAGYQGERPIWQGGFFFYGATDPQGRDQYTIFKNFRMVDMELGLHSSNYVTLEDMEVTNQFGNCSAGGGDNAHHNEYSNMHIHHCGKPFGPAPDCCQYHAIYTCVADSLFHDLDMHDNYGYSLHLFASGTFDCGSNTKIYNNKLHHNTLEEGGGTIGQGNNIQFYNNLVYNNHRGIELPARENNDNYQIYNNTFYGNTDFGIKMGHFGTVSGMTFQNNLFQGNGSDLQVGSVTASIMNHNMCATSNPNCDLTGNPAFEAPASGNFKLLASSNARNAGVSLGLFSTDIIGTSRPQGGVWDIGAYEYLEGGGPPPTGNPIYVAATGGTPTTDCIAAENQATPIRTVAGGLACMNTTPGKVMYIKAGIYAECIDTLTQSIRGGNGPSYSDATVIQSYGTDAVTIRPTSCASGPAVFFRNGAADSYIVFGGSPTNKLVIDGVNTANALAVYPSAHHIRFQYVDVKNSANFENVYMLNTSDIEFVDSSIHNGTTHGIGLDGGNTNLLIQRTMVYTNGGGGLIYLSGSMNGLNVRESTIRGNSGNGVVIGTSVGASLVNTLIYSNGGKGIQLLTGASGAKIQNSTSYGNTGNGLQCDSGASTVQVTNSIVFGNIAGNFVNNCSWVQTTNLTTNPNFVNAVGEDFHLADGSPGINAGTTLPGIVVDYYGNPRPVGANYDIGHGERDQAPIQGVDVTVMFPSTKQRGMFFDVLERKEDSWR